MRIVITAYNCAPGMGSEHSMGWHFITEMSKLVSIEVITRCEFKAQIELGVRDYPNIRLHFVPERFVRDRWPGVPATLDFYLHYSRWEYDVYMYVLALSKQQSIHLLHKLNIIGLKEPGYLYRIKGIPLVIGPAAGFAFVPVRFFSLLPLRQWPMVVLDNAVKFYTRYIQGRIAKTLRHAAHIYVVDRWHKGFIERRFGVHTLSVLGDAAAGKATRRPGLARSSQEPLRILMAGRLVAIKGFQLALKSLALLPSDVQYQVTIAGDGPYRASLQQQAAALGLSVTFEQWLSREALFEHMRSAHVFLYCSFKDATSHIVPEAVSAGCPVVCLDHCGFGDWLTDEVAIKISTDQTIDEMTASLASGIAKLYRNEPLRLRMEQACHALSVARSWRQMARQVHEDYQHLMSSTS